MDLDQAMEKHIEWKVKFRMAIFQKEPLDADRTAKDDCCALGMWLHGDAKAQFSRLETYSTCVARHKTFHDEAGKIALAINAGQYEAAKEMLNSASPFAKASSALGLAIIDFRMQAAIA